MAIDGKLGHQPIETFTGDPNGDTIDTEVVGHQIEVSHKLADEWNLLLGAGLRDNTFEGNALENNSVAAKHCLSILTKLCCPVRGATVISKPITSFYAAK